MNKKNTNFIIQGCFCNRKRQRVWIFRKRKLRPSPNRTRPAKQSEKRRRRNRRDRRRGDKSRKRASKQRQHQCRNWKRVWFSQYSKFIQRHVLSAACRREKRLDGHHPISRILTCAPFVHTEIIIGGNRIPCAVRL